MPVASAEIHPERELALDPGGALGPIDGLSGKDPAFGLDATWILPSGRAQAEGRADDNPESVRKRLQVYVEQTAPVIGYYRDAGRLAAVDGVGTLDEVFGRILAAFERQ